MDEFKIINGVCDYCELEIGRWRHLEHADPKKLSPQAKTALKIYADVTDRRGIKQEFYQVDDAITQEILETWAGIISVQPTNKAREV